MKIIQLKRCSILSVDGIDRRNWSSIYNVNRQMYKNILLLLMRPLHACVITFYARERSCSLRIYIHWNFGKFASFWSYMQHLRWLSISVPTTQYRIFFHWHSNFWWCLMSCLILIVLIDIVYPLINSSIVIVKNEVIDNYLPKKFK